VNVPFEVPFSATVTEAAGDPSEVFTIPLIEPFCWEKAEKLNKNRAISGKNEVFMCLECF
jgi:hypothetical protein